MASKASANVCGWPTIVTPEPSRPVQRRARGGDARLEGGARRPERDADEAAALAIYVEGVAHEAVVLREGGDDAVAKMGDDSVQPIGRSVEGADGR